MHDLDNIGFVKMDLLGLRNLTTVADILDQICKGENKNVFLNQINLKDRLTFAHLQKGSTTGIFQLESPGMTELLKKIQPTTIDDIALTISLYRPGAMKSKELFLERRQLQSNVEYLLPDFISILRSTYGIPIFQEQIVQMITAFSRLSAGEAEIIRKAIAKKNQTLITSVAPNFFEKARIMKRPPALIDKV